MVPENDGDAPASPSIVSSHSSTSTPPPTSASIEEGITSSNQGKKMKSDVDERGKLKSSATVASTITPSSSSYIQSRRHSDDPSISQSPPVKGSSFTKRLFCGLIVGILACVFLFTVLWLVRARFTNQSSGDILHKQIHSISPSSGRTSNERGAISSPEEAKIVPNVPTKAMSPTSLPLSAPVASSIVYDGTTDASLVDPPFAAIDLPSSLSDPPSSTSNTGFGPASSSTLDPGVSLDEWSEFTSRQHSRTDSTSSEAQEQAASPRLDPHSDRHLYESEDRMRRDHRAEMLRVMRDSRTSGKHRRRVATGGESTSAHASNLFARLVDGDDDTTQLGSGDVADHLFLRSTPRVRRRIRSVDMDGTSASMNASSVPSARDGLVSIAIVGSAIPVSDPLDFTYTSDGRVDDGGTTEPSPSDRSFARRDASPLSSAVASPFLVHMKGPCSSSTRARLEEAFRSHACGYHIARYVQVGNYLVVPNEQHQTQASSSPSSSSSTTESSSSVPPNQALLIEVLESMRPMVVTWHEYEVEDKIEPWICKEQTRHQTQSRAGVHSCEFVYALDRCLF